MAPNSAAVTGVLRQAVYYHLDNTSYDNALFFAERLAAHDSRSGESAFLLALSHYRLGDFRSASEISKHAGYRGIHLGCAYVFALSALALERYRDGISALEKSKGLWLNRASFGKHTSSVRSLYPDAATVYCLIGKLYRAMDDRNKAVACFEESLKLNPFMWDAFTSICDMGAAVRVPNVFRVGEQLIRNFDYDHGDTALDQKDSAPLSALEPLHRKTASRPAVQDMTDPFDSNRPAAFSDAPSLSNLMSLDTEENDFMSRITAARLRNAANHNHNPSPPPPDGTETPSGPSLNAEGANGRSAAPQEPPQAPSRRTRSVQTTDQAFTDAVPRMGYRLGARRRDNKALDNEQSAAPEQAPSLLRTAASTLSGIDRKRTVSGHPVQARQNQADEAGAPQRRSARLNMFKPSITKNNSGAATIGAAASRELKKARPPIPRVMRPGSSGSTVGRVVSGNRKPLEDNTMDVDHNEAPRVREVPSHLGQSQAPKPSENDAAKTEEALRWIMDLMKKLASGYQHLSQFRCQEAIQCYNSLPRAHSDTPWVLAQMGRAAYEQAAYPEAEKHFRRVRVLAPSRLEDMEVYSTILWHLKRETDLSYLSHELVDSAWLSPQAWCALGNAWSLAQDHEQALRCFKRATQLNPKFAYAYTLQGHEHVSNEEYDKALTAYRHALAADRRHYNAYYGIGKVYEKLGNYEKAYTHYLTASNIHPTNAVLICCIGTILEKQKNPTQALRYFSKATDLAPRAAQTRFKKARALLILGQAEAAKEELMILKDLAPDEAQVHFLLGKLFKSLNDKQSAVRHFTVALSLDPKASSKIKEAIESLEDDDGYDDSMMH